MVWIDYKMVYDMLQQSWILHFLKMYKLPDQVVQLIEKTMENWRLNLTEGWMSLAEVKIKTGIVQGDAQSQLIFVIAIRPLNHILRKCTAGYKRIQSQENFNLLMYMNDNSEKESDCEYTVKI